RWQGAVRRRRRGRARLLEARSGSLPGDRRDSERAELVGQNAGFEVRERLAQGLPLAVVAGERLGQAPLPLVGQAQVRAPPVVGGALALDEADLLRAAH